VYNLERGMASGQSCLHTSWNSSPLLSASAHPQSTY